MGVPAEEYVLQVTDEWELNPEKLTFQAVLGEGAFGIVRRACLETDETNKVEVAIKMLKGKVICTYKEYPMQKPHINV